MTIECWAYYVERIEKKLVKFQSFEESRSRASDSVLATAPRKTPPTISCHGSKLSKAFKTQKSSLAAIERKCSGYISTDATFGVTRPRRSRRPRWRSRNDCRWPLTLRRKRNIPTTKTRGTSFSKAVTSEQHPLNKIYYREMQRSRTPSRF